MAFSDDGEFFELPFGPPPILPDLKTELKEYLVDPEKLPIHQLDNVQQYWEREIDLLSLLSSDVSPLGTTLKYERDPITGCIGEIQEVFIEDAEKNVRNSMSMNRAPGPTEEGVRGNVSNLLFWPGGFDEPVKSNNAKIEIDFENNLKTLAKGFRSGIEFHADNKTPQSLEITDQNLITKNRDYRNEINLLNIVNDEGCKLGKISKKIDSFLSPKGISEETKNQVEVPNIDGVIEPFKQTKIPVLKISEAPKHNMKTEWAEQIDTSIPVTDFDKKVPELAITFPYELDTFQKQAILKLEEQKDVFVAAHTSAGKTTIAEYAIAMSQKHLTRTIYTSPIKALSNQKFREFKEKFQSVGLITGDIQINSTASCLIMTTEILQSMLYCAAEVIRDVEYVVFDEVHYINDDDRGHVWEEVIILLPPTVHIVMLSATVPNPLEFAHWVGQIKRRKMYVISTLKRPVPLQHYLYTGYDKKSKDQLFLIVDKDGVFKRASLKEAEAAKKEAHEKSMKAQHTKYQHAQKKDIKETVLPKLVVKPKENSEETINAAILAEKEDEELEDKIRVDMITNKGRRMWTALLDHLESTDKLPVVIFTLSRVRCDKTAEAFTESLLTHAEKTYVKDFFKKSIKHLKGTDSQLPQVIRMNRLLQLGIGVHHSGILPILKEIVEMLFQKGIVKVLFATETFAMGVNMPAKTVVFDAITKFDGSSFRNLLPTEYIQMAGRAGRRGHDETGTVIVLCKQKIPSEKDLRDMMLGAPQNLVSKFKVTYSMVLHLKRLSEAISIGDMMRRSFKEVKTLSNQQKNKSELDKIMQLIDEVPPLDKSHQRLESFCDLGSHYISLRRNLVPIAYESKKAVKALVPGRILIISHHHHYKKLGIYLETSKKIKQTPYRVFILTSEEEEQKAKSTIMPVNWYKLITLTKKTLYQPPENIKHEILDLNPESISIITNQVVNVKAQLIIQDWEKRQLPRFKDAEHGPSCQTAMDELKRLSREALNNTSILMPYVELKFTEFDLQRQEMLMLDILRALSDFTEISTPNFEEDLKTVFKYKELQQKKLELSKRLSDEYLDNYPEYQSRVKLLKELKYIDDEDRVTMKGRVALEMGAYEIFLTELVLDSVLTNWQSDEIAAMLSSLVFQRRSNEEDVPEEIPRLNELKKKMMEVYNRLVKLEKKYDLEPIVPPGFHLIRVVYEWARAKSFASIMKLTDIQEGIIVRCIQQLNETLQDVRNAAIIIGHPALKDKMEEASTKIKRDIVFTASLYTQD